jgi:hypothetical protein
LIDGPRREVFSRSLLAFPFLQHPAKPFEKFWSAKISVPFQTDWSEMRLWFTILASRAWSDFFLWSPVKAWQFSVSEDWWISCRGAIVWSNAKTPFDSSRPTHKAVDVLARKWEIWRGPFCIFSDSGRRDVNCIGWLRSNCTDTDSPGSINEFWGPTRSGEILEMSEATRSFLSGGTNFLINKRSLDGSS